MKRALYLTIVLLVVAGLMIGCGGTKPATAIVGDWEGEGKVETVEQEDAEVMDFNVTFTEEGTCTLAPTDEDPAEGTYEIADDGAITATVVIPQDEKEVEFTGALDIEADTVNLTAIIAPTEEEYNEIKAFYEELIASAPETVEGEEELTVPTLEELTATITLSLTRVIEGEEETEE